MRAEVFGTIMLFAPLIGIAGITILVIVICLIILAIVKHHRKKNGYEKENKKGNFKKCKSISLSQNKHNKRKRQKKSIRHPTYIFVIIGNLFRYVSLTHSEEVEGEEVVKLRENPNKEDKRDSYRVIGYQEDTKDNFGKKITKWRINPLDDEDIRKDKKR